MSSKTKTTATKEEAKPAPVPKLRFPEFRGKPGWEPKRLGLTLRFQAGFPFPSSGFNDAGKGLRLIRNRDLRSDDIVKFYSDDFDSSFVVNNGDVLVGMDGDFTPTVWEKGEALLNQRVGRILPRGGNDHRFLLYLLTLCLKGIEEATARTTVKHLSHSAVEDKHEPLPSPAEQQKIAECLSSVDELMAAQTRKVDALKTHKKGLMQQLFPREGETQPRLRFPEFQNAGDWEETRLGRMGELVSGLTYSPDDVRESGLLVLRSSNVQQEKITLDDCVYVDPSVKGANLSQPNDILICVRNGSKALIGKCALIPEGMPLCTHGAFMTVFRAKTPSFVFQLFQSDRYQKQVAGDLGATINSINGGQFLKYTFFVPKPPEQERIAACMSSIDALITAETQKHEALKTHKKGLMQQLFPSPEQRTT